MRNADSFHGWVLPTAATAAFLVLAGAATAQAQSGGAATVKGDATACANDAGLKLPTGFCASIFADKLGHVRHIVVAPDGVLYANTRSGNSPPPPGGFLIALQDTTGRGQADVIRRFGATPATGGHGGTGIALYGGYLYAELNDRIVRYRMSPHSIVPTGRAATVISGLPLTGDHPMHPFVIDAHGWIYMDSGSPSNSCQRENRTLESPGVDPCPELTRRAGIWRYSAKKLHQKFSAAARYATGIRNGEGLAFDSEGHLYSTQHGRDQLSQNWPKFYTGPEGAYLPAEELMRVVRGGDYGWPYCYYDEVKRKLMLAPEYGGDNHKVGRCVDKRAPVAAFPGHWAPNDLALYYGKQFPSRYQGGAFIAFHGSWNRAPFPQQGYDVVFQPLAHGKASGSCEIFADGFSGGQRDPGLAAHRPSGLAVGPDGALYVSDDAHGRVYKIVYQGGSDPSGTSGITACPDMTAVGKIAEANSSMAPGGTLQAATASLPVPQGATREMLDLGDRIFHGEVASGTCSGCHGAAGQGTPLGPDLTSGKWTWSDGSLSGIEGTVRHGVPSPKRFSSPMPAMGGAQLDDQQISAVAAYVWGLGHAGSR